MGEKHSSSIWTPANIVTCTRIALVPLWLALAEVSRNHGLLWTGNKHVWAMFILYVLISLTDKLDGYLARSRNEVSDFGKFADPIADKLSVSIALVFLLEIGLIHSWVLFIVLTREFMVSGLRMVVASKGEVVAASSLGKWKTATTMVAICLLLFSVTVTAGFLSNTCRLMGLISMAAAMALTAWSGVDYFIQCWPYISESE